MYNILYTNNIKVSLQKLLEKKYLFFLYYYLFLKKTFPKYLKIVYIYNNEFYIFLKNLYFLNFLKICKYDSNLQYKILVDICIIDYLITNQINRFKIIYALLTIQYNNRINLFFFFNELKGILSITSLYENANWLEREIWDMFGIFFFYHKDLRRILTDYGFKGFPLRKDFPLTGFKEIYYQENKKRLIYKKLILSQEYRLYTFRNPWNLLL